MIAVPMPVLITTPDAEPIVAIATSLLLHVPPLVASLKVMLFPVQIIVAPVMAAGYGLTVAVTITLQPLYIE
jgi:hypothetical protein